MIKAVVKYIQPASNGFTSRAFGRSRELVSQENPKGELIFYVEAPDWTGGRPPHIGQEVMVGQVERKTKSQWPQPRWIAHDVSPAYAIRQYSPTRLDEPTIVIQKDQTVSWLDRFFAFCGLRPAPALLRKA